MSTMLRLTDDTPHTVTSPIPQVATLLIATDGSELAEAAFRAASEIARRSGAGGRVLAVLEQLPAVAPEFGPLPWSEELEEARRAALLTRVRQSMERHLGDAGEWAVEVRCGPPAATIAAAARECEATMIVLGLGQHGVIGRLLGEETALQALRLSDVPVLAVPATFAERPRRALVATDFSDDSVRAARAALPLLRDDATIYLTHVVPRGGLGGAFAGSLADPARLAAAFDRVRRQIGAPPSMTVETITLKGDAGQELLDFADCARVDLMVTGSHGYGFVTRLVLGSVATALLRGARCAVLAVPAPRAASRLMPRS